MRVENLVNNPKLENFTVTPHIRKNHIEIEDEMLRGRFKEKGNKTKMYSKFTDEKTAAGAIAQALKLNIRRISNWENSKVDFLKIFFNVNDPIGYGFDCKGDRFDLNKLTIILCKNNSQGFRIKSAYPS